MMNAKWVVGELGGVLLVAFDMTSSKYTVYRIPARLTDAPRSPPVTGAGLARSIAPACYPKGDHPGDPPEAHSQSVDLSEQSSREGAQRRVGPRRPQGVGHGRDRDPPDPPLR